MDGKISDTPLIAIQAALIAAKAFYWQSITGHCQRLPVGFHPLCVRVMLAVACVSPSIITHQIKPL